MIMSSSLADSCEQFPAGAQFFLWRRLTASTHALAILSDCVSAMAPLVSAVEGYKRSAGRICSGAAGNCSAMENRYVNKLAPVLGIAVFLLAWEAAVRALKVPAYLLPPPSAVATTFVAEFPKLLLHGWVTFYEMVLGFALAVAVALPLAIGITSSARFDRFVMPMLLFFQVVPKVAIAPLFLVWFGIGTLPKVLVAFLISFFPIVIDATVGLRSMSSEMRDLARSMGATPMQLFARFRLPGSLPYLFSGLKVAATLAVAGAVVGEFVGADKGLGYLLLVTNSNLETALMFATLFALTIIGLLFFYAVELLEALLIPWHVTHRVREDAGTL